MSRNNIKVKIENMDLIYGLTLGDGHLSAPRRLRCNSHLDIVHCAKQHEYILFKKEILDALNIASKVSVKRSVNRSDVQFRLNTSKNMFWTTLRSELYMFRKTADKTKKRVTVNILNKCSIRTLFLWFLDDGYNCPSRNYVHLSIYDFTMDEAMLIQNWIFNITGFDFKIYHRKGCPFLVLYKGASEFKEILKSSMSVPECMTHKFI